MPALTGNRVGDSPRARTEADDAPCVRLRGRGFPARADGRRLAATACSIPLGIPRARGRKLSARKLPHAVEGIPRARGRKDAADVCYQTYVGDSPRARTEATSTTASISRIWGFPARADGRSLIIWASLSVTGIPRARGRKGNGFTTIEVEAGDSPRARTEGDTSILPAL